MGGFRYLPSSGCIIVPKDDSRQTERIPSRLLVAPLGFSDRWSGLLPSPGRGHDRVRLLSGVPIPRRRSGCGTPDRRQHLLGAPLPSRDTRGEVAVMESRAVSECHPPVLVDPVMANPHAGTDPDLGARGPRKPRNRMSWA